MIQSTDNRLSKIKKKLQKNQKSHFQYLLRSLGRQSNKQNRSSNKPHLNKTSLKYSIQVKKPSMVNSVDNFRLINQSLDRAQFSKINLKNNPIPFFENVKFLKDSRIDVNQSKSRLNISKQTYQKNIELSQKAKSKRTNESGINQKSNKFTQRFSDNFQSKLQAYVEFVNQLFNEVTNHVTFESSNQIQRKKCILQTLGQQILRDFRRKGETVLIKTMSKSIEVSNFCSFPSKTIGRQLQQSVNLKEKPEQHQFKKIIDELSSQNSKLTQLISQHERKNIKIFIQMNENQSKQIEKCKKYLSTLYDKYKILQKSILKENKKFKQACQKNTQMKKTIIDLQKKNNELSIQLDKMRQILNQNQSISKTSFQEELQGNTIFDFNLNERRLVSKSRGKNCNLSVNQSLNIGRSFVTKREKASSCLSTHFNKGNKQKQEDIMSCSTITKAKGMKKNKNKPTNGINLKSNFHQNTSDEINVPLKKENIPLQRKLNEQSQFRISLSNKLDELQRKLMKKDERMKKMQKIINQQILQIQKLMKINSNLANQIKITPRSLSTGKKQNDIQKKDKIFQKLVSLQDHLSKSKQPSLSKIKSDEYRIIAMQAQILQNLLNFS